MRVERSWQAGCQLDFLPIYSPDFNSIEHAFAKAKQSLRRISARSFETMVVAIGEVLPTITTADARAFFAAAGFAQLWHVLCTAL